RASDFMAGRPEMKLLWFFLVLVPCVAFGQSPDMIFSNGKIVTVDDRFSVVQALAIRGSRIVAIGSDADVLKLKGPATKIEDLQGRTVIPGLIDNHAHFIRAPEHDELRFDGVTSRTRAIALLEERVRRAAPGEWIVTLGG